LRIEAATVIKNADQNLVSGLFDPDPSITIGFPSLTRDATSLQAVKRGCGAPGRGSYLGQIFHPLGAELLR
jgi:hypothetical protein